VRRVLLVLTASLCLSAGAAAQIHPATSLLSNASPSLLPALPALPALASSAIPAPADPDPAPQPVFWQRSYDQPSTFQFSLDYAYFRFEGLPKPKLNLNGVNGSFASYVGDVGVEIEVMGVFGNVSGQSAKFAFVGGGPRIRFLRNSKIEPWMHVVIGRAHLIPQTPFGGQGSVGFEGGMGVDYRVKSWLSWRTGADALATLFFKSYQLDPKIHSGIVINF